MPYCSLLDVKKTDEVTVSNNFSENKVSTFDYLPTSTTKTIILHKYFSLSYKENSEQAEWVAYKLSKADCLKSNN
ncbi:MAG: endonuclease G [Flavobacterium sp.]